jgi:DNA-directed DNA polymerase III PolC
MKLHSCYSLKYGILSPEKLVEWGVEAFYSSLFLADINSTGAVLSFVQEAQKKGIKPIVGVELRNDMEIKATLIARNNRGLHEINSFLSRYLHQKKDFPDQIPHLSNCYVSYPFPGPEHELNENEYIDIQTDKINNLKLRNNKNRNKIIVLQGMTFRNKADHNTHRLLRSIHYNTLLSLLEPSQQTQELELLKSKGELENEFNEFADCLNRTFSLFDSCLVAFDFNENVIPQNPATFTGSISGDEMLLRKLCLEGLPHRYNTLNDEIVERIEKEIEVIAQKQYLSYFLITWDFTSYARAKGCFYVGRGSGANSIVAYLLRITNVDPLQLDLYFERFINLERSTPPDFDIDFSWQDRDEIIHYIFERYPTATLLCTYNTFQYRATIRELGKVFGLPKGEIDKLVQKDAQPKNELSTLIMRYTKRIQGLPSYLSVHSGGIVISEKPITWFSATFLPPKGFSTTQFSMLEAEDVGLFKFDVLSQRGLAKIHDCIQLVHQNQPENPPHNINDIDFFKRDKKIEKLLIEAKAIGCFYVESPAMRMLMTKLRVKEYLELVAASSVIRPGVSQSGMMRTYIRRHRNPEERKKAHPLLLKIMPDTYGVMVYQEDVIKVAHYFAGLSLSEADILRRGMSGKYRSRSEFLLVKEKFFTNCKKRKHEKALAEQVWDQIESFAGYAFAKGHSASYAVESYQSLYLKAYYPLEYMTAGINNFGGYYRTEFYIQEARRMGAIVEAPCINKGGYQSVIAGKKLTLGFNLVRGVERKTVNQLLAARKSYGDFNTFEELVEATSISFEQLVLLIRINALRMLDSDRKKLLWKAHFFDKKRKPNSQQSLLLEEVKSNKLQLPALQEQELEQDFEFFELMGFPLCSPFRLLKEDPPAHHTAAEIPQLKGKTIVTYGYLVSLKNSKSASGKAIAFAMFNDIHGEIIDTVHFTSSLMHYPFSGSGVYCLKGKVVEEFDFYCVEIFFMKKQNYIRDPRFSD